MNKKDSNAPTTKRITAEQFHARRKRAESLAKLGLSDDDLDMDDLSFSEEDISPRTSQYSVEILGTDLVKPKKGEKSFTVEKYQYSLNHQF